MNSIIIGVKLQGQRRSSLIMKTLTKSGQFSIDASTFASSTGSRLKSLGSGQGQTQLKGLQGKREERFEPFAIIWELRAEPPPCPGPRPPGAAVTPRTWSVAALRAPLNNNETSNFEILFVFRCSKPGFQQRKWKRETKRAFPHPPASLSLVSICNTLFLQQAKTTRKAENKIWIFPSFFTVNLCKNNEKILDYIRWPVSCFFFFFFLFLFYFFPFPLLFLLYSLSRMHFNFAGGGKEEIMFCRNTQ